MAKKSSIENLLEEGLGAYGHGNLEKAIESWRLVLELEPGNAMALDYLKSAGVEIDFSQSATSSSEESDYVYTSLSKQYSYDEPPPDLKTPGTLILRSKGKAEINGGNVIRLSEHRPVSLTERIKPLLKDNRYVEALDLLYTAKRENPQDVAIGRAIQHVKDKYVLVLIEGLGPLDQLVALNTARNVLDELDLCDASRRLTQLIDNETSIGDLINASMLQKHIALAALSMLCSRGLIRLEFSDFSLPPNVATPSISSLYSFSRSSDPKPLDEETLEPESTEEKDDGFDALFRKATLAYVHGDLANALSLFQQCEALRPGNERVEHNIQRLRSSV